MEKVINHEEAVELAELKQGESNLARCYLEATKLLREWVDYQIIASAKPLERFSEGSLVARTARLLGMTREG